MEQFVDVTDVAARLWDVLFVPAMKLRFAVGDGYNEDEMFKPDGLWYEIYCVLRGKGGKTRRLSTYGLNL